MSLRLHIALTALVASAAMAHSPAWAQTGPNDPTDPAATTLRLSYRSAFTDAALAERLQPGQEVEFALEKASSGYVISAVKPTADAPKSQDR